MRVDPDGQPCLGRSARTLGVRVAGPHGDVRPDDAGRVHPGAGGMSVTVDDPARMPVIRRPYWVGNGTSEDPLFQLEKTHLTSPLGLRIDRGAHALVEPALPLALETYETSLAETRPRWRAVAAPGGGVP